MIRLTRFALLLVLLLGVPPVGLAASSPQVQSVDQADGADATQGAKADTASTDPTSSNSLMSFLKGLVKIFSDIWDDANNRINVGVTNTVTVTDGAGAMNVIVDSSALPTGAATAANQDGIIKDGTGDTTQANVSSGRLQVDGSGVTQPVSGTVTANAGTNLNTSSLLTTAAHDAAFGTAGTADSQVRTVQGIAGMTPLQVQSNAANMATEASLATVAGVVDATGTAVPANAAFVAGTDGTNTRALKTDTSGELQVDVLTLPANASVNVAQVNGNTTNTGTGASGTGTQRVVIANDSSVKVWDGTNTASVNASGQVAVNCANCSGSGVSQQDNTAFTGGSSNVAPVGALYDTTPPTVTDGNTGIPRMDSGRLLYARPYDGTNLMPMMDAAARAGNQKITDGTDTAQVTATGGGSLQVECAAGCSGGTQYAEDTAAGAADQVTMAGAVRKDTAASLVDADGDRTQLQTDNAGRLRVTSADTTQPVSGTVTANAGTNLNTSALLTTTAHDNAFGTAGSADTQVRTVQGIASMTPLQVQSNSANVATETTVSALNAKIPSAVQSTTDAQTAPTAPFVNAYIHCRTPGANTIDRCLAGSSDTDDGTIADGQAIGTIIPLTYTWNSDSGVADWTRAMQQPLDYDSGAGTENLSVGGLAIPGSGGPLAVTGATRGSQNALSVQIVDGAGNQVTTFGGGTEYTEDAAAAADPVGKATILVRQDTPATIASANGDNVAQRGTNYGAGYVQVITSSGAFVDSFGGSGGTAQADRSAFTDGTTSVTPIGGCFNETNTNPTEDQAACLRITDERAAHVNLRTATGTEIGTSGAPLRTDPTGTTTQPVSGTVTVGTFPDNEPINVAQMNGVAVTMGNGASGTGVQRVTIASDSTGQVAVASLPNEGQQTMANSVSVAMASDQQVADPCTFRLKSVAVINIATATTTQLVAASSGNKLYVCSINLGPTGGADNVALVEDDTSACASPTAGMAGGTTSGSGWNIAANGGLTFGSGMGMVAVTAATNRYVCLITSAAVQLSGTMTYVLAP